jgi:3-oxoacyl-[acyl-carrier-protein] synthase-3
VRKLSGSIKDLLARNGRSPADIGLYLFHQANANLLRQVATQLAIPAERVFVNIERYGNTSSASLLIAAAEACEQGLLRGGSSAVLAAFGSGFSYGSLLLDVR